jgi:hypothetical protein
MQCPACHTQNAPGVVQCVECGAALSAYPDDDTTVQDPGPADTWFATQRPWEPDATRQETRQPWEPETPQPWTTAPAQPSEPAEPATRDEQPRPWEPDPRNETAQLWTPDARGEQPRPWEPESPGERTQVQPWGPAEQSWRYDQQPGGGVVPPPEPEPWMPPPVRPRNRNGRFIVAAWLIVVVAAVAAVAIAFWPHGKSDKATPASSTPSSAAPSTEATTSAPSGDAKTQATAVNTLLDGMASSRSELSGAVTDAQDCAGLDGAIPTMQKVVGERAAQVGTANSLQVSALDNGDKLKEALTTAVQASLNADNLYLKWANDNKGCSGTTPTDSDLSQAEDISQTQAGPAKVEFLTYWTPIAQQQGLPARDRDHI